MVRVEGVPQVRRQLGAHWVDVELAELAPVEESLHGVATDIADALVLARALGSNHETEGVLRVHEGGEGGRAGATVLMQIEVTVIAPESGARPAQRSATTAEVVIVD